MNSKVKIRFQKISFYVAGTGTLLWFLIRVIPKPSRAAYPCMRAAAPVASGFVIYLLGLFASAALFKKSKQHYFHSRYLSASLFFIAALFAGLLTTLTADSPAYANTQVFDQPANTPSGTARGINPGRVVWIYNPDATVKTCGNTLSDAYWLTANNNQNVIDQMVSSAIQILTGETTDAGSWNAIFRYFNQNHGKGSTGYVPGEKIMVKINATSGWSWNTSTLEPYNYTSETSPQVVFSVLKQLVNVAGVAQSDIYVGDPMKHIYQHCYTLWHGSFPNVHYLDNSNSFSGWGREQAVKSTTDMIYYSDRGTILKTTTNQAVYSDYLYQIFKDAAYVINIPALKAHARAGISLFAKNHLGSQTRSDANHLHNGLVDPAQNGNVRQGTPLYRLQVDLMAHKLLGGKELFYLLDGLWAGPEAVQPPTKWTSTPFNTDWTSSIFASQDPVAIESVGFDFLRTEYLGKNGSYPQMNGVDDYLHQAADPAIRPAGITYDPENDGIALTASLGVHEHWNNAADKQYTRNLGTGNGIELIYPAIWSGLTSTDWNTASNWWTGVVPSSAKDVIITSFSVNQPVISGSHVGLCHNLTLLSGTSLTINPGGALTVSGNLSAGGTLIIDSDGVTGNGSLIVEGTSSGNVTCKRQLRTEANWGDYHYVSSPVSGQAISGFRSSDNFPATVWEWQENNATPWQTVTSGNFVSGRGYNLDQSGGTGKFAFKGSLVTSPFVITATAPYYSTAQHYNDKRGLWGGGGWNLLGNPFTSALDASKFITANLSSFDPSYQALYIYDGVNNDYKYAALSAPGESFSGDFGSVIQAGQGFFVFPNYNGLGFTFTPGSGTSGMQTHNTSVEMKSAGTPWPGLQLKVQSGIHENSTLVVYNDKMNAGLDPGYDVGLMNAGTDVEIYTALVKDNGVNFARQALPLSDFNRNIIPVGVDALNGGTVTFSADVVPIENRMFVLEDRLLGTFTNLGENFYTVTLPENTMGTGRFFIHAALTNLLDTPPLRGGQGGAGGAFRIWTSLNRVYIEGAVTNKATAAVYDLLGHKVAEARLNNSTLNAITLPASVNGIYLVRVVDGEKSCTKKMVFSNQ